MHTGMDVTSLFIKKTLLRMYPRLQHADSALGQWLNGPLIPDFLVWNTLPDTRRIVEIGCGDGVFSNILSLLFPNIEVIGLDTDPDKIAYARTTINFRENLKFVCGYAGFMTEIPCDRIIYSHCLATLKNPAAFKKLILKTSPWLVAEGDFLVRESPLQLLLNPVFLKSLTTGSNRLEGPANLPKRLLAEIGYSNPLIFQAGGLPGLPPQVFYQMSPNPALAESALQSELQSLPRNGRPNLAGQWVESFSEEAPVVLDMLFPEASPISSDKPRQWEFA